MQVPIELISSPLNYTGGKTKLLPQILPLFPDTISTFVDLFCGGCNVAINTSAQNYICNDINSELVGLFSLMKSDSENHFKKSVKEIITNYKLSDSDTFGYSFYNCDSANGLGTYNKEKFLALRDDFNKTKKNSKSHFYKLYVLIVYAFNNQIRFNTEGKFNLPVGKRDYNKRMQEKLSLFLKKIHENDFSFLNQSFKEFSIENLPENSFVYADPPYLITTASYNEKNGWTEEDEKALLSFLDLLNEHEIKFALSNVLETDGKENTILKNWLSERPKYKCNHLVFSYKNSNYHKKNSNEKTDEVLIINY